MDPSKHQDELAEQYVQKLIAATISLQKGADDREINLHALIQAAEMLKQRLEHELEELREEND